MGRERREAGGGNVERILSESEECIFTLTILPTQVGIRKNGHGTGNFIVNFEQNLEYEMRGDKMGNTKTEFVAKERIRLKDL